MLLSNEENFDDNDKKKGKIGSIVMKRIDKRIRIAQGLDLSESP